MWFPTLSSDRGDRGEGTTERRPQRGDRREGTAVRAPMCRGGGAGQSGWLQTQRARSSGPRPPGGPPSAVRAGKGPSCQARPLSTCPATVLTDPRWEVRGPDWGTEGKPRLPLPASCAWQQAAAPGTRPSAAGPPWGPPGQAQPVLRPRTSCWRSALSTPPRGSRLFPAGRKTQGQALVTRLTRPRAPTQRGTDETNCH